MLRGSISSPDFDEVHCTLFQSARPYFFFKMSSAVLQDAASIDDLPVISLDSSKDEDDSNGELQKRNLFRSLQHNPSVTRPKPPADFSSATSSSKTTNGVSSTPQVKEIPEILSNSTSDSFKVVVYPKEHHLSLSVPHHSYGVPMIQPSVTQASQSSVIHNDDNLDDQQNTSKTNNRPDSTTIIQLPLLTSKKSLERDIAIVRENSFPGDFATEKPSTSPSVQSQPLNSTTTDCNPPVREVEARQEPNTITSLLNLVTPQVVSTEGVRPPKRQQWRLPLRSLQRISDSDDSLPSDDFSPDPDHIFTQKMEELRRRIEVHNLSPEGVRPVRPPERQQWSPPLQSLQCISVSGDSLPFDDFSPAPDDIFAQKMKELRKRMESNNLMAGSRTSPGTLSSRTTATPKAELRPQLQTLQEDNSSEVVAAMLQDYKKRKQARQTQLHKALAQLRELQAAKNKPLTGENQSQQHSISHFNIALDKATHEQDNLTQLDKALAELRDVQAENERLTSENQSQQCSISHLKLALDGAKHDQESSIQALAELRNVQAENKRLDGENQSQQRSISHLKIALDEAKHEQENSIQTLAELRDVQAENKRLDSENQSQQRSISHLKLALDEAKHEQENSTQALAELRDVQAENKRLASENQSQQRSISHLKLALDEAKHGQEKSTQALAELRDVQVENKRLASENQSQQRSLLHLKIALDEAKHEQDNLLVRINNQLRITSSSLALLSTVKKGWQDKFDLMQHKLNAAERQVRCLDHLTRHKLESRLEAGYGQPKRRGLITSIPASTDVIGAMRALNEEIYQTCVLFVEELEGLERTAVFSTNRKPQVQKALGFRITAMMEDQAKKATSGYNMLLMQTVLEVFMTHWCSSIIEAFYPQQESFADLLVQLSAQNTNTSGK